MATLIMTRGLPASGKSTWAKAAVLENPNGVKRINKDSLRHMVHANAWSHKLEKDIIRARDTLIMLYLNDGYDVIVDDTNFGPHEADLRQLAASLGAHFQIEEFDTPVQVCIERDLKRPAEEAVGKDVIIRMWKQYIYPHLPPVATVRHNLSLADCIICDIDGTVAHHGTRSPFDMTKVDQDTPRVEIIAAVKSLVQSTGAYLVFVSGRNECAREKTAQWLKAQGFDNFYLFLRADKDCRRDSIVKREIYENSILPNWNVLAVFDDRPQVLNELWRPLGLPTFDVGPGIDF